LSDLHVQTEESSLFVHKPIQNLVGWTDADIKAIDNGGEIRWHTHAVLIHDNDDTQHLLQQHMAEMNLPEGEVYRLTMPNHTTVEQVVQFLRTDKETQPTTVGVNIIHSMASDIPSFLLSRIFVHNYSLNSLTPQHAIPSTQVTSKFTYIQRPEYLRGDWNAYPSSYFFSGTDTAAHMDAIAEICSLHKETHGDYLFQEKIEDVALEAHRAIMKKYCKTIEDLGNPSILVLVRCSDRIMLMSYVSKFNHRYLLINSPAKIKDISSKGEQYPVA
jgi:hypothetical protein